jgi:MFS transporter, SP family, sugar:H+ symporter
VLVCGWLWDPLGWLIQSEVFTLEIRSPAQSIVVCVNMFFTLYVQLFLLSLCHLKYGFFLLFVGLIIVLICFVFFLFLETKEVSAEEIDLSSF